MKRLVGVELTRLRWRRAAVVLMVLGALAAAAIFVGTVVTTSEQSLDDLVDDYGSVITDEYDDCLEHPRRHGVLDDTLPDDELATACERQIALGWGHDDLDLVEQREGSGVAVVVLLTLALLLAGTTFAGHDWNTGSMANQLLFEPRRARVWGAKLAAVVVAGGAVALAVLLAYWTGLYAVASGRDLPIPDHAVSAAYKQAVLGAILVAGAAGFGYALTMLLRSTVGTLGLLFGSGLVGVVITQALGFVEAERVMPWGNFTAFVVGSYRYYDYDGCFATGYEAGCDAAVVLHRSDGSVYFLVVLLVVGALSLASFRRRDVP
jgi:hypothetical protein